MAAGDNNSGNRGPANRGGTNQGQRRVIGTEHIARAHSQKLKQLEIRKNDIVTDLARESAAQLGVELVIGPLPRPSVIKSDGATQTQRTLFRRSPKWSAPEPTKNDCPPINRLAVVGVGGVGGNIAHLAANSELARHIALIDITPGIAAATALDLQHASGITNSRSQLVGGHSMQLIEGADVVVITAGRPRTTGMTRNDLIQVNQRVMSMCSESLVNLAPNAIVIIVTNPLDEMTLAVLQSTGFPRERVLGMAGTLDSSRFRFALAAKAGCDTRDVQALTLGSHGDEMVPLHSLARIKGRPLSDSLSEEAIASCVHDAVHGGGAVVALRKTGSATIAPAHAVIEVLQHIRGERTGWVPVSVYLDGEYGYSNVVMGIPAHLGPQGLVVIEELPLSDSEKQALHAAFETSQRNQADMIA
jgi:malate dehydrogenase